MTEIDRILENGVVQKEFLRGESRNGFYCDTNRKKIWAIELDLLVKLDQVCKKNNLTYFLIFGSLLGAVRHGGFIPWDDDLDIAMPRKDYDALMELDCEFENPYFLQNPYTDAKSGYTVAKLRNSNTAAIPEAFRYSKMNQGIFIDINPIDNIEESTIDNNYRIVKHLALQNSTYMRMDNPKPDNEDIRRLQLWEGEAPQVNYKKIHKICSQYDKTLTAYKGITVSTIYNYKKQMYLAEDFEKLRLKKFENIIVPIPAGYDDILKRTYGDYSKFPPLSERKNPHTSIIFNTEKSYREFL